MEYTEAELKDLRMRRYVVLPSMLGIIILLWVFLAFKFERELVRDYFPLINSKDFILNANIKDAVIEKFKFKVTFKEATINLGSRDLKISSDGLVLGYNPLNDYISVSFDGRDVKIGDDETGVIISSPDLSVDFSRDLLVKNYDKAHIGVLARSLNMKSIKDNKLLYSAGNIKSKIACELNNEGFYRFETDINIAEVNYSYNPEEYIKFLSGNIIPKRILSRLNIVEDFVSEANKNNWGYVLQGKMGEIIKPREYKFNFIFKLHKDRVEDIAGVINGTLAPKELLNRFDFLNDKYTFSVGEKNNNDNLKASSTFRIANDGRILNIQASTYLDNMLNEETKAKLFEIAENYLRNDFTNPTNFSTESLIRLIKKIIFAHKMSFSGYGSYHNAYGTYKLNLESTVNNTNVKLQTEYADRKIEGTIRIKTPQLLISNITDLYDCCLKEYYMKEIDINQKYADNFFGNLKNNGVDFLTAFDNANRKIKNDRNDFLESDFIYNLDSSINDIKVNGIELNIILKDPRVVRFFDGMPKLSETES